MSSVCFGYHFAVDIGLIIQQLGYYTQYTRRNFLNLALVVQFRNALRSFIAGYDDKHKYQAPQDHRLILTPLHMSPYISFIVTNYVEGQRIMIKKACLPLKSIPTSL
jgi:hypothetical protein